MREVLAVRNEYRAQNWAMVIQKCSSSGLTNREFCRQRGISEKSYYYWLRKLRDQVLEAEEPRLVQLSPEERTKDILQIHYRGAELCLPGAVDLEALTALLPSIQSL